MYLIEGPKYGFTTLNASVYWAIVTVTTVGYGDITPHTPLGRIVASVLILIGYSVIAIPTGLITTHMSSAFQSRKQQRKCPRCHQGNMNSTRVLSPLRKSVAGVNKKAAIAAFLLFAPENMAQLVVFLTAEQDASEDIINFATVFIGQPDHHFGEEVRVQVEIHMLSPVF